MIGSHLCEKNQSRSSMHLYKLAHVLANSLPGFGFDRQHVAPITHGHERGTKRMAVDLAANFDEPFGAKEFR